MHAVGRLTLVEPRQYPVRTVDELRRLQVALLAGHRRHLERRLPCVVAVAVHAPCVGLGVAAALAVGLVEHCHVGAPGALHRGVAHGPLLLHGHDVLALGAPHQFAVSAYALHVDAAQGLVTLVVLAVDGVKALVGIAVIQLRHLPGVAVGVAYLEPVDAPGECQRAVALDVRHIV